MAAATRRGRFGEYNCRCACLARLVEQLTLNQLVPGSNPGAGILLSASLPFRFAFGSLTLDAQSQRGTIRIPQIRWSTRWQSFKNMIYRSHAASCSRSPLVGSSELPERAIDQLPASQLIKS